MKLIRTILTTVCVAALFFPMSALPVSAAEASAFDGTSIEEDLKGIDLKAYTAGNEVSGLMKEMGLVEYAYSDTDAGEHYGLYFYVYHATGGKLSTRAGANSVNMATAYGETGEPAEYSSLALTYLDSSADGRFYKFRLTNSAGALARAREYASMHNGERRYDIASIDLWEQGQVLPTAYEVGKTYRATGFAKGCGEAEAESTLEIHSTGLEVIPLQVKSTYYLTGDDTGDAGGRQMLSSVYFSVPQDYMENYGALQFVKADWWEYRTSPMIVTADAGIARTIEGVLGYTLQSEPGSRDPSVGFSLYTDWGWSDSKQYGWVYNQPYDGCDLDLRRIDWLFKTDALIDTVAPEAVAEYAYEYKGAAGDSFIQIGEKRINEALFDKSVETGHTRGYNSRTIDLRDRDDYVDLKLENTTSTWEQICNLFRPHDRQYKTYFTQKGIAPIYPIDYGEDLVGNVSDRLYIADEDVDGFKRYCDAEARAGNQVFLLRFSVNDYLSKEMYFDNGGWGWATANCYAAVAPIFLNFKIIELGFIKERTITVLGTVSSPVDIFPPVVPPVTIDGAWAAWCITAACILLVLLVADVWIELAIDRKKLLDGVGTPAGKGGSG